jgi:predicted secreted protein
MSLSTLFTFFAIYMVVWWTVLFAVLPLGTVTYAEAGIEVTDGGDPGAPVDPKLGRKAFTTTWVSGIIYGLGWLVWHFHLIHLPNLPSGY